MTSSSVSQGIDIALQKAPRMALLRITLGACSCSRIVFTGMPVRTGCATLGRLVGSMVWLSNTVIGRGLRRHSCRSSVSGVSAIMTLMWSRCAAMRPRCARTMTKL